MKVKVERAGPCRRVLRIEVPKDVVAEEYRKVLQAYSRAARIPGFRPGRAPASIVEGRYAKDVAQETRDILVPRFYREALEQEKIKPVAVIDVRDTELARDRDFAFDVVVDIVPDFRLPNYKGISLGGQPTTVTDAQVDQAVQTMRERLARYNDVSGRPVQIGDLVRIDYRGVCDGQPVDAIAPPASGMGEGKDFWVLIRADGADEFLPGLSAGLQGASKGESRRLEVNFPPEFAVRELAGKKAIYDVTVGEIREQKLPDLDEAFLKDLGVESLDALRKRLREGLAREMEQQEKNRLRGEIIKFLVAETKIEDLPQSLVEEEMRQIVRDIVHENVRRGVSKEEISAKKDDILNAATHSSAERVKIAYVLDRIAEAENIVVQPEEIEARIQAMAARYGVHPSKVKSVLEKRRASETLQRDIRAEKTLDFLLQHATVTPAAA